MKTICLLTVTFLLNLMNAYAQPPKPALQLYSFRAQFAKDVPGTMAKVQSMGVKYVELAGTYGLSVPDFLKLLQKHNLTPIGTGVDFDVLEKNPQQAVDDAKTLGVKYVVCFWIPHKGNEFTIEDVNKAVTVFNKAGKLLKDNGFSFCYHPHGYEFRPYGNGTLFDELAKNLTRVTLILKWIPIGSNIRDRTLLLCLQKYPKRFPLLHVKDRKIGTVGNQNGQTDVETNVVLGTGDVGLPAIMKEAAKIGVEYAIIEDESSRSEAQVPLSIAFLKGIK